MLGLGLALPSAAGLRPGGEPGESVLALYLDGAGGYAMTPHAPAVDLTGDLALVAQVAPAGWEAGNQDIIAKWGSGDLSYMLRIRFSGQLMLQWADAEGTQHNVNQAVVPPTDGSPLWIAATLEHQEEGALVQFYTSSNPADGWALAGGDTRPSVGGIQSSGADVHIGSSSSGAQLFSGRIYRAQIYSGAGFDPGAGPTGTLAADFHPEDAGRPLAAPDSFLSAATGETWTLSGSAIIRSYAA